MTATVDDLVAELVAAFPWPAWSGERMDLFARKLSELPFEQAVAAVEAWLDDEEEPPTPAGLKRKALEQARKTNPYVGTEFEHFPVLWDCTCGKAHRGTHTERPTCPTGGRTR